MGKAYRFITLSLAACLLLNCSGDSDSGDPFLEGDWEAIYNLIADSCGIVAEGDAGFLDVQTIASDNGENYITSSVSFSERLSQSDQSENRVVYSDVTAGDLFGDGSTCSADQSISYEDYSSEEATSLFNLRITCADGFACETRAVGNAKKIVPE